MEEKDDLFTNIDSIVFLLVFCVPAIRGLYLLLSKFAEQIVVIGVCISLFILIMGGLVIVFKRYEKKSDGYWAKKKRKEQEIENALRWSFDGLPEEYKVYFRPRSEIEGRLQAYADSVLHLFDHMPRIKVKVVNESIRGTPDGEDSAAYCHYEWEPLKNYIAIKMAFLRHAQLADTESLVKHEMIHAWMYWKGLDIWDNKNHGPIFKWKAEEVGGW